jgi:alpha-L-rhamnosidase
MMGWGWPIAMRVVSGMLVALSLAAQGTGGPTRPSRLQVENRVDPLGVDVTAPRLSWILPWEGAIQRAYQVRAATSGALLDQGTADLWDSGRVESRRATGVVYGGVPLHSRARVFWQVRVWSAPDPAVPSGWSDPATWEMGLLDPADWTARWIAHPT